MNSFFILSFSDPFFNLENKRIYKKLIVKFRLDWISDQQNETSSPLPRSHRWRGCHLHRQIPPGHRYRPTRYFKERLPSLEGL